jgi:Tat protein translocase TatC
LRTHLLRAIYGFLIAFAVSFFLGGPVVDYLTRPVEQALKKYWTIYYQRKAIQIKNDSDKGKYADLAPIRVPMRVHRRELMEQLGLLPAKGVPYDILSQFEETLDAFRVEGLYERKGKSGGGWFTLRTEIPNPMVMLAELKPYEMKIVPLTVKSLSAQESFTVYFQVCMFIGLVIASPWVLWQLWSFVAVGLYPHEKQYVHSYFPMSVALFLIGVVLCELLVIPQALEALLWFNDLLNVQPDFRLTEWMGFAVFMPLVFGLSFETPLVMLFLERMGIFTVQTYRSARKVAIMIMAVFAAFITPSTDMLSMLYLLVPMCIFYEVGIWLCLWSPHKRSFETSSEQTNELVEV